MPAESIYLPMSDSSLRRWWKTDTNAEPIAPFAELFDLYAPTVLRVAQRLLGNSADAQDAAQEVFLRLHQNLHKVDQTREVMPWLYRVTVNVCHDLRRRTKQSVSLADASEPASSALSPEQAIDDARRQSLLRDALEELGERERDAIVLRDIEGLTTAQVAAIVGVTEATVRSQISIARVKIRQYLARRSARQS